MRMLKPNINEKLMKGTQGITFDTYGENNSIITSRANPTFYKVMQQKER